MAKNTANGKKTLIKKRHTGRNIAIVIVIFLILAGGVYLLKTQILDKRAKPAGTASNTKTTTSGIAVMVGTIPITNAELDKAWAALPATYKQQMTKDDMLRQLVDERLLLLDAKGKGITISDDEVNTQINNLIKQYNITQAEFEKTLATQGATVAEFKAAYKNRLTIAKLFNVTILSTVQVTDADAQAYYDQNKQLFNEPAQIRASHILVNTTDDAQAILTQLKNGANFSNLAKQKSIDPSAQQNGGDLGFFAQGTMVPAFEDAAFKLAKGELSQPVKTDFGYHIILVTDKKEARMIPFSEVKKDIIDNLKTQDARSAFAIYLSELENKTKIVYYNTSAPAVQTPVANEQEPAGAPEETPDTTQPETTETTPPAETTPAQQTQTTPPPQETQEKTTPTTPAQETLGTCLTAKGAILYGAYWNKDTQDQLNLFADDKTNVPYVECGIPGDYATQKKECKDAGIVGYPTWKIAGKLSPGVMTPDQLKAGSGC